MHRIVLAVTLAAAPAALAQRETLPSFEVASVKFCPPPDQPSRSNRRVDPQLLSLKCYSLKWMIMEAFNVEGLDMFRVTGGPGWVDMDYWDVEARAAQPASRDEIKLMLRSLLADRFQLKYHVETKLVLNYVLTVAKGGPKFGPVFQEVKEGDPPIDRSKQPQGRSVFANAPFKQFVGILRPWMTRDPLTGKFSSVTDVPPIIDETGLTGRYNIVFDSRSDEDWAATLERQLGLRLTERKVPTDIYVIDSAAKPSGN